MDTRYKHFLADNDPVGFGLGEGSVGSLTITRFPMVDLVRWLLIFLVGAQQRRIGIQGLLRVNDHSQRLVLDLDSSNAIGGCIAAGSNDKGYLLHLEMHAIKRQDCLGIS